MTPKKQTREAQPGNRWTAMYLSLGRRLGQQLFDEVRQSPSLRPRWTPGKILAFVVAGLVHSLTLAFVVAGVLLIFAGFPFLFFGGVICLAIAWAVRPRLGWRPAGLVPRSKAPTLYGLVDRICAQEHAPTIEGIEVTADFNASVRTAGLRQRTYLALGIPFLAVLEPQELVALLGHEVGHQVNGDPLSGRFIGSALATLHGWYDLLRPSGFRGPRRVSHGAGVAVIAEFVADLVTSGLAVVVLWVGTGLTHLVWRQSQRAEYLADHLARQMAGTHATAAMFGKLALGGSYREVVQTAALGGVGTSIFDRFRDQARIAAATEGETGLESKSKSLRLDPTHPPTAYRIAFVRSREVEPRVTLSSEEAERIDAELRVFEDQLSKQLVEGYRASLYR